MRRRLDCRSPDVPPEPTFAELCAMAGLTFVYEMMSDQARGEALDAIASMVGVDDDDDGLCRRVLAAYASPMIWRAPGAVSYTDGM